jgi:hypothetical protein
VVQKQEDTPIFIDEDYDTVGYDMSNNLDEKLSNLLKTNKNTDKKITIVDVNDKLKVEKICY